MSDVAILRNTGVHAVHNYTEEARKLYMLAQDHINLTEHKSLRTFTCWFICWYPLSISFTGTSALPSKIVAFITAIVCLRGEQCTGDINMAIGGAAKFTTINSCMKESDKLR